MQALMAATSGSRVGTMITANWRGFLVSVVVAVAAQFLSEHYGAPPAMLMALLLGIAFPLSGRGFHRRLQGGH